MLEWQKGQYIYISTIQEFHEYSSNFPSTTYNFYNYR